MAEDITTDGELRIQADAFGDVQTVRGDDNVVQQIRLALSREIYDIQTAPLTPQRKRELRRGIRDALRDSPYVDRVVAVKLAQQGDEQLQIEIQTESENYGLTL